MSKERKLVNKIKRRTRSVVEAREHQYRVDTREETLQDSPKAYKLMRKPQRRMDRAFGYDTVGDKPHLEYNMTALTLARFDFDPGAGTDFGLRLTLPTLAFGNKDEVSKVTTVADVAGSLNSKYFLLDSPSTDYYVWYNINSLGVDPLVPGRTGVMITGATNASAATLATSTKTAVDALALFVATNVGAVITITGASPGNTPDTTDGAAPTGFTFSTFTQGALISGTFQSEIGFLVGDLVVIEEEGSQVENRMLQITAVVNDHTVRLDDVATFSGTENNVTVRFILSGVKKSYK